MNIEFFFNGWQCSSLVVPIFSDLWAKDLQHGVEKTFTISFLFLKMHCLWCGRESIIIFLFPFRRRTPKSISDKICTVVSKVYSQYKIKLYNNIDGRRLSTHNDQLLILWFRKPTKSFYVDDLWWKLNWNLVGVSVFYFIRCICGASLIQGDIVQEQKRRMGSFIHVILIMLIMAPFLVHHEYRSYTYMWHYWYYVIDIE